MRNIRNIGTSIACTALILASCGGGGNSAIYNDGNSLDYSLVTAQGEVWSCYFPFDPTINTHVTFSNNGSGRLETVSGGSGLVNFSWSNSATLTNPRININLRSEFFVLFDFSFYNDLFGRDAFNASDSRGFDFNCTRVKLEDL